MKVFKFGGASISTPERMQNTASIIHRFQGEKLMIVISAMGKTTNALEAVTHAFVAGKTQEALQLFEQIKQQHLDILKYLNLIHWQEAEYQLKDLFTEIEWLLHDKPVRHFDYYYDQIVSCGELYSTAIMAQLIKEKNTKLKWLDVRDFLRTDNNFRDAGIDWSFTAQRLHEVVVPLFDSCDILITQGFIGATDENESTTLGREGSDFSAAIFANLLNGESVTIWKDVEAVMSADPRKYPEAVIIPSLSFTEVIEMAYYGAQVIHPKTIKPLQNKNIPLMVKSFIDPDLPGTLISAKSNKNLPPIIVKKEQQVLVQFRSKDFSFVEDRPAQHLQDLYRSIKTKPNISQHTAISLLCCFDDHPEKIDALAMEASALFDVAMEKNLTLLTIRHFDPQTLQQLTAGKTILLEQRTTETVQLVMR